MIFEIDFIKMTKFGYKKFGMSVNVARLISLRPGISTSNIHPDIEARVESRALLLSSSAQPGIKNSRNNIEITMDWQFNFFNISFSPF